MGVPTFTSREFNRSPGRVKRAAADGPVIITERGKPVFVVLTYADYQRLKAAPANILDALDMPGGAEIELDLARPVTYPRSASFE
jgi:prevent-host-death family protein